MLIINEKGLGSLTGTRHISKPLQKKNKPKTKNLSFNTKQVPDSSIKNCRIMFLENKH